MRMKKLLAYVLAGAMTLSLALTGCGSIDADEVGATLDGKEISLGFMNFMAKYTQAENDVSLSSMYAYYTSYFGYEYEYTIDEWKGETEEGITQEEATKDSVVESLKLLYLLDAKRADYGVELTEEEDTAIGEAAAQFMSDNSKKAIKRLGATEEYVKEMLRLYTVQQRMKEAVYAASTIVVTDEEAAQRTFSYIEVPVATTTDEDGNTVDLTEDEQTALASEMAALAASAKTDFDTAVTDAGYTAYTYTYGTYQAEDTEDTEDGEDTEDDEDTTDTSEYDFDEAVMTAANALSEGGISDLITTEENYYIIRLDKELDEEKTAEKKEELLEERKAEEYEALCEDWTEAAELVLNEKAWKKVKFTRLFGAAEEETTTE